MGNEESMSISTDTSHIKDAIVITAKSQISGNLLKGLATCTFICINVSHGFLTMNSKSFELFCRAEKKAQEKYDDLVKNSKDPSLTRPHEIFSHVADFRAFKIDSWVKAGVDLGERKTFWKIANFQDEKTKDLLKRFDLCVKEESFSILDTNHQLYKQTPHFGEQIRESLFEKYPSEAAVYSIVMICRSHTTVLIKRGKYLLLFDSFSMKKLLKFQSELLVAKLEDWKEIVEILKKKWGKSKQVDMTWLFPKE